VELRGLYLGTSQALFQIQALSFLPPGGYAQLFADEQPGPDHLEFKLTAAGDTITLHDATGTVLESVTYSAQTTAVSEGRLPDGTGAIVRFVRSASPAAMNYLEPYAGPLLNEVLARNQRASISPWGNAADWIELNNPAAQDVDLGGMALGRGVFAAERWVFPTGSLIRGGAALVVWCDGSRPASTDVSTALNTGFALEGTGGEVVLFNAANQVVDSVRYGFQLSDLSIGWAGGEWQLLSSPTPGGANDNPAVLGPPTALRINEWMSNPLSGEDWFELHNTDPRPVDMSGLFLTDNPSTTGVTNTLVGPLSFVGGGKWVRWVADDDPSQGSDHARFQLDELGETIRL
jgi:hypothetical protein